MSLWLQQHIDFVQCHILKSIIFQDIHTLLDNIIWSQEGSIYIKWHMNVIQQHINIRFFERSCLHFQVTFWYTYRALTHTNILHISYIWCVDRRPGRRSKQVCRLNKRVHQQEQLENIWLLSLMLFSCITQSVSTRLVIVPKKILRACGLANYLWTVSRCSCWQRRLHSCPVEQTTSPVFSNLSYRVEKQNNKIDTCCLTLGWYVIEQIAASHMSCFAEWAAVRWGPPPPPTPICQVVMTEGWLWHEVSLWWRSWNMIMIPNHWTSMVPLWHCEIGYHVVWWHGSKRHGTADQKKGFFIFWITYVRDYNNTYMLFKLCNIK